MIPFKTACAAARKLAPGKVTLPCCTLHVEHPDGYDDVVMTVQFESSLRMDVDVRSSVEPFAFLVGSLPTDTISIEGDGPHGIACRNAAGAVCKVERFPAHKEIMHFDHTPPGRDVVQLDRTMLRAASIVGRLASRENTSKWSRQKVALVVRGTTIIGAAGTNGYALKLVGDIDAMLSISSGDDWEIMIPPPVIEAMMQLDAASWELHVDRAANETCLATSYDVAFRWVYTPGAQWRLVVQRHTPERRQYALHAGRILAGMKKVKNTHILFELAAEQQRWSFLAIRTDKQIKGGSPRVSLLTETLDPNGPAIDLEREITLDTELVRDLCTGVIEPVTIDVKDGFSAAVLTAEKAAKDLPYGMYAVIMPIRPESRA